MNPLLEFLAFNASRFRLWQENAAFAASVPRGALVLDAGSGNAPYKPLFQHARYESADFAQVDKDYAPSTYVCDLRNIPVEDGRFDFIIFNQVIEHLPEPRAALQELHRVLKEGGKMICTGPLFYEEHEQPYDFYRYTQFGLRHLFGATGFRVDRLDWLEGYFGTVGYQLQGMARHLPWKPGQLGRGVIGYVLVPFLILSKALCAAGSVLFQRLETCIKFQARGYPKNYVVLVSRVAMSSTSRP
jgi:SAM-dependent methyltransferase